MADTQAQQGTGPAPAENATAGGYGAAGKAPAERSGPYAAGPLTPGLISSTAPATLDLGNVLNLPSPEAEKETLVQKLNDLQRTNQESKAKWWSFCKVHGEGVFDAKRHDVAFLTTFFEAFENKEIADEFGCPFVGNQADGGKGGWNQGQQQAPVDPSSVPNPEKVFIGGLPKTTTEDALKAHFSWYGTIMNTDMKYDPEGGFRGFAFISFQDTDSASKAVADSGSMMFQGRKIDVKHATGTKGGGKGGYDKGYGKGYDKGKGKMGDQGGKGWGSGYNQGGNSWGGGGDWNGGGGSWGGAKGSKDGGKGKSFGPNSGDDTKIFVGGIPKSVGESEVWNFFSQFGEIAHIDLKYDEMGTFRGFGFITFSTAEGMDAAVNNSANNYLGGKWVDVKPAAAGRKGKDGKDGGKGGCCGKGGDKGKDGGKGYGGNSGGKGDWGSGGCNGNMGGGAGNMAGGGGGWGW